MSIIDQQARKKGAVHRISGIARSLGIGFIAAVITGIISGLLLRLIMKIIALVFPHMASGFTFQGTFLLVLVGIGFLLPNSMIFMVVQRYLPKGWVRKGLLYGFTNLVVYGIPFFLSNPDHDLFGPQAPLGITLFSFLFFLGGVLLAKLVHVGTNWIDHSNSRLKYVYISFALFIVPAIVMLYGIMLEIIYDLIPAIQENFFN